MKVFVSGQTCEEAVEHLALDGAAAIGASKISTRIWPVDACNKNLSRTRRLDRCQAVLERCAALVFAT